MGFNPAAHRAERLASPAVAERGGAVESGRFHATTEDARISLLGLLRGRGTFDGGVFLPGRNERTGREPIIDVPCPALLRVPLVHHAGAAAEPVVRPGAHVCRGELIAVAKTPGALAVHAPCAGRVTALGRVDTSVLRDVPSVEIAPIGPAATESAAGAQPELTGACGIDALIAAAGAGGVLDLGPPAQPLGDLLERARQVRIKDLIINTLSAEPMLTSTKALLLGAMSSVVATSVQIRDALKARRVWIAVSGRDSDLFARARRASAGTPARVIRLSEKYPQHIPVLLTLAVAGREVPYGADSTAAAALVLDATAVAALGEAMCGTPVVDSVVTVAGPGAARAGDYRVPIGTPLGHLLRAAGLAEPVARMVEGGLMNGVAVASLDWVTTRQTRALLLLDHDMDRVPKPVPCIRCGWCQEDCPVGLDPRALLHAEQTGDLAGAATLYPHACVGCGVCSYVCPAELPLAEAVTRVKARVPRPKAGGA